MKHCLEPVRVIFRPLVYYFVTDTIMNGIIANSIFYLRGYQFVQIGHLQFWTYYNQSKDGNDEEPIVLFHGLGVGLLTYEPLISCIQRKFSRNRRIILISMRCISMRYPSLNDIPNMVETTDSIKMIFEQYKLKKAIFIGHR
jgi:pimeloyl-ACP methyl ester carboxylesterase